MGYIAHMNFGYLLYPWGDHRISDFVDNSDLVNAIADRSQGFVWRLKDGDFELPENDLERLFGRPDVAAGTLSIWENFEYFEHFVHKTVHGKFLTRRGEWFENIDAHSYVIWPVDVGHVPSLTEGKIKLMFLRDNGPGEEAYDFESKPPG